MTAYVVLIKEQTRDAEALAVYAGKATAARAGHALTPLALYGRYEQLEGEAAEGAVIISFPTMAEARAWYDSPAYQEALAHRQAGGDYRVFLIEGVDAAAA
ncbi:MULTISPECIES: DUF1330 domain-containing protein [Sphingomonadales]|uniref:DUF1330 domain-containing protein n=1 Tax=Edaphosphingomonas haloaromaticamans TaxID=653954 RepID=A0A1S1HCX6_9SPHN|nr:MULTISPECIES: DUF1330 domain-containing protein [Sphingomonas]AGH51385.1 hypothetical protein G432_18335 [Sphingomonas sp. MM-1]OHT19987.1 hypothetical protein BHE75_01981 [Sphingomonas haloaromaticamans]